MHIGLFHNKTGAFSVSVRQRSEKSWHPAIYTQGYLVTTATTIIILYQMPIGVWPGVMEMKRSPPKDTEAQKDYSQWSLRGGKKERRVREGKGSRMGREERMRKQSCGADGHWSGLCPCYRVAFYYPSSPHCHPRSKSHSAPQFNMAWSEYFLDVHNTDLGEGTSLFLLSLFS